MTRLATIPDIPDDTPQGLADVLRILKQDVEVLAGLSGDAVDRAIKHGDALVADIDAMQAVHAAGATPTQAEFDALVDDVTGIRERLNYLLALLRGEEVGA